MKLLRLKLITPFRSLGACFEVHFLREWDNDQCFKFQPSCLAGRNGSGKSNVLEALAAIFYHIECIHLDPDSRPTGFMTVDEGRLSLPGFNPRRCKPDAFELEYAIPTIDFLNVAPREESSERKSIYHVRIKKAKRSRPIVTVVIIKDSGEEKVIVLNNRDDVKRILPTYVIGYSSGHNEVLSLPFLKMRFIAFDEYHDKLVKQVTYPDIPEARLIYLDDQFSQVILLCHYLFPTHAVTNIFAKRVELERFRCFQLIIRRFKRVELEQAISQVAEPKDQAPATIELTDSLAKTIDKLIRCATAWYEVPRIEENEDAVDLYLDYWLDDATIAAFNYHFRNEVGGTPEEQKAASALYLFHSFRILLTLNFYVVDPETKRELYESASLYVNETIPTPPSHERIARFKDTRLIKSNIKESIYLKNLSDGEHQFLHTIGLCLLFRYESALFLLDEPETHLNPEWRASYVSTLREALEADGAAGKVVREILITSHSPFIISDCQRENVFIFEKDERRKVRWRHPAIQTFGASATLITKEVFGRRETIGDLANDRLKQIEASLEQPGRGPGQVAQELDRTLGDSIEKTIAISRILQG